MQKVFHTKQFKAGNSAAVRIPANMAFPHHTNLIVRRKGNQIIVEPKEETLERILLYWPRLDRVTRKSVLSSSRLNANGEA